jgi:ribosomal protein S18 acetylase RimI-like enzyme
MSRSGPRGATPSGEVIAHGRERARTGPWRGDHDVALLTPVPDAPIPSVPFVQRCLGILAERGYSRVVTGALAPSEQRGFIGAGFQVAEELHLLAHDLGNLPARVRVPLRRAREDDYDGVLEVDNASFSPFWRLDRDGLLDTLTATPRVRFRVADGGADEVLAYVVVGRAGRRGYLQRLAVAPTARLHGLGSALVIDGLWWLRRWRVDRALVNTQHGNDQALALYKRLGFMNEPVGLAVLEAACG